MNSSTIKVIVAGADGKMGRVTVDAINQAENLQLVATASQGDNLGQLIDKFKADVVVDFTTPSAVFNNSQIIIQHGARPVIGTTGLKPEQIAALTKQCADLKRGAIIAPNFSLGAILMMRFAREAAKYLNNVEIIELHHDKKLDAPSGTAIKTAALIAETRQKSHSNNPRHPAQGELHNDIPIHSVRLPGFFAHQRVIFGGQGETLTLSHDSIDRNSMMPGVILSCKKVLELDHLIYGLENIL